jgi:uncharacterized protein (DUF427 family)
MRVGMSLTIGRGAFGHHPAGRWNFTPPDEVGLVEPLGRRLRATLAGETVIDSEGAQLVHVSGRLPVYALPPDDVHVAAAPIPQAPELVTLAWDAVDAWFEEDERMFVHPRDPYHRIDSFATTRRVEIELDGVRLASSTRVVALYETGLPPRWYFPGADVDRARLRPSETVTECAYKGTAHHWSAVIGDRVVDDVAWSYAVGDTQPEGDPVAGRIAFYDERVDVTVDGSPRTRPQTPWSH